MYRAISETPDQRDINGDPTTLSSEQFPEYGTEFGNGYEYAISYGFKNTLIRFAKHDYGGFVIQNNIDLLQINNLTVTNVTMYNPNGDQAVILSVFDNISSVSMDSINVTQTSSIRGPSSLFNVANYGSFSLSNAEFTDINKEAAEYDMNG